MHEKSNTMKVTDYTNYTDDTKDTNRKKERNKKSNTIEPKMGGKGAHIDTIPVGFLDDSGRFRLFLHKISITITANFALQKI